MSNDAHSADHLHDARGGWLSAIIESSADAIYACSFDGTIVSWNRSAEKLYGYSADEIVGRSIGMIIPAERRLEPSNVIPAVRQGKSISNFETLRRRRDGTSFVALLTMSPIRNAAGIPVALSVIARDMSERKTAEANLVAATAKFESVFNQSRIFEGIMDTEGYLRECNDLALCWCGYSKEEVLDRLFWETPWWRKSEAMQERVRAATAQARAGGVFREELHYWFADGSDRIVDFAMHPIVDEQGRVIFLHPTGIDITERKKAEALLHRQYERAALLSRTLEELLAAKDPETLIRELFPRVAAHVEADFFLNFMVDENGKALTLRASAGISDAVAQQLARIEFGQALCGRAALERRPIYATEIQSSRDEGTALVRSFGLQAYYCHPLLVGDDLLGTLTFASRARAHFEKDEVEFLTTVAQYTAIAMHRLRSEANLRRSEERLRLLLAELNHRSKNMLALVQAVARQTAKSSGPEDFIQRFERRIHALAASQDLLINSEWKGVGVEELVRTQLAHFQDLVGTRIALSGPVVNLTASAAQGLGMALHELATNAGKYGALSGETGRVAISWQLIGGRGTPLRFAISWVERDGPAVSAPDRRGFGSTVVDRIVRATLNAAVELDYAPEGLSWRLKCLDARAVEGVGVAPPGKLEAVSQSTSPGRRVLLVEDEPLLALEVATAFEDAGYVVVGPAGSVRQAFDLLAQTPCECAVLDVNLGTETAAPIADQLSSLGVPFLTVSGYSRTQQPRAFSGSPFLAKPVNPRVLVAELERCVTNADAALRS